MYLHLTVRNSQWLFTAVLLCIVACSSSTGVKDQPFDAAGLYKSEAILQPCLDSLQQDLSKAMGTPPAFGNIPDAANWTYERLPTNLRNAFHNAGESVLRQKEKPLNEYSAKELERYLFEKTAEQLEQVPEYKTAGCGDLVPEKLENLFFVDLHLGEGELHTKFSSLGLGDSYETSKVFLLMLTLKASSVSWHEEWFAKREN